MNNNIRGDLAIVWFGRFEAFLIQVSYERIFRMDSLKNGVYFITGAYGVGKTSLCDKLKEILSIPYFSASELISVRNNETYGASKAVKNKAENQNILKKVIEQRLLKYPIILLNGHTAIFKKDRAIDLLPIQAFHYFHLRAIILLETTPDILLKHLEGRDNIIYSTGEISALIDAENQQCQILSTELKIPLLRHIMQYDDTDYLSITAQLQEGNL